MQVLSALSEGSSTPFQSEDRAATERSIARGLLGVRSLHLLQAVVCLVAGWKAYRRPRLALGLFVASCAESAWVARRVWKVKSYSQSGVIWVDTGFGVAGLIAMTSTMDRDDRTAFMNWMCPLTIGAATGASVAIEDGRASKAVPGLLAGAYLFSVRSCLNAGGSQVATALANTASYAGFYSAARVAVGRLRKDSEKLEAAREETLIERERLAAERERNREHRLLHDSALQTLELVAKNADLDAEFVRSQARKEARVLRRAISGEPLATSLVQGIRVLADEFHDADGLQVELALVDIDVEVSDESAEAVLGAVREALTNVTKHSGASNAVVTVAQDQAGTRISVRDRGKGFDQRARTEGFGIANSIIGRLSDVGGTASVDSDSQRGTKVMLWVPRRDGTPIGTSSSPE
jgi:signal transduction histidine kinase